MSDSGLTRVLGERAEVRGDDVLLPLEPPAQLVSESEVLAQSRPGRRHPAPQRGQQLPQLLRTCRCKATVRRVAYLSGDDKELGKNGPLKSKGNWNIPRVLTGL